MVLSGARAGAVFASNGRRAVVGSQKSADVVLSDPTVSRFHCEIELSEGGEAKIRDLCSRNGTWVDGVSVLEARLRSGSVLALGRTELRFELGDDLVEVAVSSRDRFGLMIGRSPAIRAVFALLERAAATDVTVLLEGETGTGKEVAAESVHRESARRDGPLIIVDCGSVPPNLLESELFGHVRGSFTGASTERKGAFEEATGGTIFLDEIGELELELQPKLLRALEAKEIKRIGSSRYGPVDVRVIAATNRDLRAEVNRQTFRPDLYYRLAVMEVRLPPLRERTEDLPSLVEHLLEGLGAANHPIAATFRSETFVQRLARHAWPGNIRELRNYLERSLALHGEAPLPPEPGQSGVEQALADPTQSWATLQDRWSRIERRYLMELLERESGKVSAAARAASIDRLQLYRLLWKHGLR